MCHEIGTSFFFTSHLLMKSGIFSVFPLFAPIIPPSSPYIKSTFANGNREQYKYFVLVYSQHCTKKPKNNINL